MAEQQQQQVQQQQRHGEGLKSILPEKGPKTSQILAIVTLLPVGGVLLFLGGVTLMGTLIGLAVTTPLFVIFSPVLVPATLVIGLAVTGFLTAGAFGVTALSSLSWMARNFRSIEGAPVSQKMEHVKRRTQEAASQVGQKAKETAQEVTTGQEGGKAQESRKGQESAKT